MRRLDVEEWSEQRLEHSPLIEAQAVHDDEHRRLVALQDRQQELGDDVNRERWPVPFEILEPIRIVVLDVQRELAVHVRIETLERLIESHLAGGSEVHIPAHQLVVAVDPATPVEIAIALELDRAESLDEAARDRLLTDARALENLRDDGQHLTRVDRLDEIVADVDADRFLERRIFLALRDHHDRHGRRDLAHISIELEPPLARHLFIEEHDVERPAPQKLDRIVGVGRPLYGIAFGAQEDAMRLQKLAFIVYPEYRFGGV